MELINFLIKSNFNLKEALAIKESTELKAMSDIKTIESFYRKELKILFQDVIEILKKFTIKKDLRLADSNYRYRLLSRAMTTENLLALEFTVNKQLIGIMSSARPIFNFFCNDLKYKANNKDFSKKEVELITHMYNYHNIEKILLIDKDNEEHPYHLTIDDFEKELNNINQNTKKNYFGKENKHKRELIIKYESGNNILYIRKLGFIGIYSYKMPNDYESEDFIVIK